MKVCNVFYSYQKFAKGKDLSRYETADLQSIFGQRQKQETADSTESPEEVRQSSVTDCILQNYTGQSGVVQLVNLLICLRASY